MFVSLYKDTNLQLQTKLDSLILEIDKFTNDINMLHTELQDKDNIIGILHFKYGKEFPNVNIYKPITTDLIEEPHVYEPITESTEQVFTTNSIEKELNGIKISSNRGIKISKRS